MSDHFVMRSLVQTDPFDEENCVRAVGVEDVFDRLRLPSSCGESNRSLRSMHQRLEWIPTHILVNPVFNS